MPSMFSSSRRRTSSTPPNNSNASSAAALAATSAFLNNSAASASLSSAAAAAALRSHTVSPEPIGNIQTKRMARRGSQSSIGSGSIMGTPRGGMVRGPLARRDSQGSMTERTFRSPSPGRMNGAQLPPTIAPAIPSVPKHVQAAQRNRSASLEPPMRVTSPTPKKGSRHASVDRTSFVGAGGQRISSLPKVTELDRETSINYSRPMATDRPTSPTPVQTAARGSWYASPTTSNASPRAMTTTRPASSLGLSRPEGQGQGVQSAANSPVAKKKKATAVPGANLASTTTSPRSQSLAPATQPLSPATQSARLAASAVEIPKKKKKTPPSSISTDIAPPPRNPARLSSPTPDDARNSPRSTGTLSKQPAAVRADPVSEVKTVEKAPSQKAPTLAAVQMPSSALKKSLSLRETNRVIQTSAGPARAYVAPGAQGRSVSLEVPRSQSALGMSSSGNIRDSLSPPRAHFLDAAIVNPITGIVHNPPPRSVSPAKSALKHSPSPASSIRAPSPVGSAATAPKPPPSDTSDTQSMTSQDGIKPPKKKKSARVSFDDGANTVSAGAASSATPSPASPAGTKLPLTPMRRSFSPSAAAVDESSEMMHPRPELPSFGSVRKRDAQAQSAPVATEANGVLTKSMPAPVDLVTSNGSATSAGPVSSGYEQLPRSRVVSAEAPASVSGTSVTDAEPTSAPASSQVVADPREMATELDGSAAEPSTQTIVPSLAVPDIAVLPATPGIEEGFAGPIGETPVEQKRFSVPGGWGEQDEARTAEGDETLEDSDVYLEDDSDSHHEPPTSVERHEPLLEAINESETDDDSAAFSDAAEEQSDHEGFASMDAIVESPLSKPTPAFAISTPTGSPLRSGFAVDEPPPEAGDWSEATAYWSSLSRKKKEQIERAAVDSGEESSRTPVAVAKPKKKTLKPVVMHEPLPDPIKPTAVQESAPAPIAQPRQPRAAAEPLRKTMRAPAASAAPAAPEQLRKTMRAPAAPAASAPSGNEVHMRNTMRSSSGGAMRTSMRDGKSAAPRRTSSEDLRAPAQRSGVRSASAGNLPGTSVPASAIAAATLKAQSARKPAALPLSRVTTNDSDSESSFKKKRRTSVSTVDNAGRYSMKRSMRSGSVDAAPERVLSPTPAARGSSRLSVRSISPTGSFFGRNRRAASIDDTPTMRGKNSKALARDAKSPTRFSMSGFSKTSKPEATRASASRGSAFKSRFNNSDSDDDAPTQSRIGGFRSRFVDSDDEDSSPVGPTRHVPAELTPVRGIPKRTGLAEVDSTELDDSDEAPTRASAKLASRSQNKPMVPSQTDVEKAMDIARRNVAAMTGNASLATSHAQQPFDAQAGKRATMEPQPQTYSPMPAAYEPSLNDTPKKRRGLLGSMLGRKRTNSTTSVMLSEQTSPQYIRSPPASIRSPKLQRRNTPTLNRLTSDFSTTNGVTPTTSIPQPGATQAAMAADQGDVVTSSRNSTNWPLPPPPKIPAAGADRPNTSDGVADTERFKMARTLRPEVGARSQSGLNLGGGAAQTVSGTTGKKKKFGGLRKFFGLHD